MKTYLVTFFKDSSDAVPCQDIMSSDAVAAMDPEKIARKEEMCSFPDCRCPIDCPNGWCAIGLPVFHQG